jgi:DNA-binding MarR family transcriptional regulator
LVDRGRSPADRRRNVVRLTHAGAAEHERLLPRATRVDEVLTRHLSHEEGVLLRRLLQRVLDPAD